MILGTICLLVVYGPQADVVTKKIPLTQLPVSRFVRQSKAPLEGLIGGSVWQEKNYKPTGRETLLIASSSTDNSLVVKGEASVVEEFERFVSMFDVKPMSIEVDLVVSRPFEKVERKVQMTVENNEAWTFTSSVLEVRFDGCIRINEDGSLTISAKIDGPGGKSEPKVRTLSGHSASISVTNKDRPENDITWTLTPTIAR